MEDIAELIQKIDVLFQHLGIDDPFDEHGKSVIDTLHESISNVRRISEFNAIIVHEMIKDDLIPPIILKKAGLNSDISILKQEEEKLSDKYEVFRLNGASNRALGGIANKLLKIGTEIDRKENELDSL